MHLDNIGNETLSKELCIAALEHQASAFACGLSWTQRWHLEDISQSLSSEHCSAAVFANEGSWGGNEGLLEALSALWENSNTSCADEHVT